MMFDGEDVELFLRRYEKIAAADGADDYSKVIQIGSFVSKDVKEDVEDMEGYIKEDWKLLKKEMVERWGKEDRLRKYKKDDLRKLVKEKIKEGGIKTRDEYNKFIYRFEAIIRYLIKYGYMQYKDEANDLLLKALDPEGKKGVTQKLYDDKRIIRAADGGYPTPALAIIKTYVYHYLSAMEVLDNGSSDESEAVSAVGSL